MITAPQIEVQGHRGARAVRPENTLVAFDYALSVGVDTLELDLGVTKDDQVVVTHDQYVNPKLCRGLKEKRPIRKLTLKELKRFDCGSLKNPRFPKQQPTKAEIPTLDEVFQLVKRSKHKAAKRVGFNIETKIEPSTPELTPDPETFARLVIQVVKRHGMEQRTVVQSFDHRTLVAVKKIEPKIKTAMLGSDSLPDYVAVAKSIGAEIISPHKEWITKEAIEQLQKNGIRVIPWTANSEEDWQRLIALKVDGIITDDPAALIAYLKKRGLR